MGEYDDTMWLHHADGFWSVLGHPNIKGSYDLDVLLHDMADRGWDRMAGGDVYVGHDLVRVHLERHLDRHLAHA